jgi:hypothetical protein
VLILGDFERRLMIRYGAPGGGRPARRWLRWPVVALGPIITSAGVAVAVAACSAGAPAGALRPPKVALDRAAAAAVAVAH